MAMASAFNFDAIIDGAVANWSARRNGSIEPAAVQAMKQFVSENQQELTNNMIRRQKGPTDLESYIFGYLDRLAQEKDGTTFTVNDIRDSLDRICQGLWPRCTIF